MNGPTVEALRAINRTFYQAGADAFDARRQAPWKGWKRLLTAVRQADGGRPLRVLDVGCGNGRLCTYLRSQLVHPFSYLGLDASLDLLTRARKRNSKASFLCLDVLETGALSACGAGLFGAVAAFGLLHHVPGFAARRQLVVELARHLEPGGVLLFSFWQFPREARFEHKALPWTEHNRGARQAVATDQLEEGDHLLSFGPNTPDSQPRLLRYCHFVDADEAAKLVSGLGLTRRDTFYDDGKEGNLNLYLALERS